MIIAALIGLLILFIVVRLSRRGQLSFRYTIGWIGVASFGLMAGLFVWIVEPLADLLGLSAAALLGLGVLLFLTVIAIQLSVSISGLQRQVRTLVEEIAEIEFRFRSGNNKSNNVENRN